ncbi:MAG: nucleotide exchange factor GrpE [Ardenticatenales bacterium]|nr:nucleotide exchange factor GrpE [Ardenticatenales bacterium]
MNEPVSPAPPPNAELVEGALPPDDVATESPLTPVMQLDPHTLWTAIQGLVEGIEALQRGFDSKLKYDSSKERIIDTLHQELQAYREDMHFKILRPLFMDLITLYDDLGNLIKHAAPPENNGDSEGRSRRNLESLQESIEEILYRNGVAAYHDEGDKVLANRQRSIKTISTDQLERDRLIAERLRKGFEYEGKILRPEIVSTFKFVEELDESSTNLSS